MINFLHMRTPLTTIFCGLILNMSCAGVPETKFDISSPTPNQAFNSGDTLSISALLTGVTEEGLHGYQVYIRNKADQTELFANDTHVHGLTAAIDLSWIISVSNSDLEVEIISVNNHNGGFSTRKIDVRVN